MNQTLMKLSSINYDDPKVVTAIKNTIAKELDDGEFTIFERFCRGTLLDPFKREVWAIKTKGYVNKYGTYVEPKLQIMTGINGFYTIANSNPDYDGIQSGLITPAGLEVPLTYPKHDFIGAWARVYSKTKSIPMFAVVMLHEYKKADTNGKNNWSTMPRTMIVKCAEAAALRKAMPQLNGLYIPEEMGSDYELPDAAAIPNPSDENQSQQPTAAALPHAVPQLPQPVQRETIVIPAMRSEPVKQKFFYAIEAIESSEDKLTARRLLFKAGGKKSENGLIETSTEVQELATYRKLI